MWTPKYLKIYVPRLGRMFSGSHSLHVARAYPIVMSDG